MQYMYMHIHTHTHTQAAAEVRLAAIDVLVAVAVTRADIQAQRLELSKTMNDPRLLLRSGRSTPGTSATNSQSATPFSFSRSSSRPQSGGRSGGDLRLRRLALKAEQDLAYGDLVRHAMVVEALGERLCDMDRGVRWAAAQALVQSVAEVQGHHKDVLDKVQANRGKQRAAASGGNLPNFVVGEYVLVARVRRSGSTPYS